MARITTRAWNNYIGILRRVSDRATKEMLAMITTLSNQYNEGIITLEEYENAAIDYAYALPQSTVRQRVRQLAKCMTQ